jgi:hypothetical protein
VSGPFNPPIGAYLPQHDASSPPGFVTLAEAAARCGLSEAALRGRAWRGKLPVVRTGGAMFVQQDVAEELAEAYRLLRRVAQRAREQAAAERGGGEVPR